MTERKRETKTNRRRERPLGPEHLDLVKEHYDDDRLRDEVPVRKLSKRMDETRALNYEGPFDKQRQDECDLTPAEILVLRWSSYGLTNDDIGKLMGLSMYTIKDQRMSARRKLRAKNTAHAIAIALRRNLIP